MAFFFGDGFDLYSAITDCGSYWDSAFGTACFTLGPGRFAGSRGLLTSSTSGSAFHISKTSGVNDAVHHLVFAIQQTTTIQAGTNVGFYVVFLDGATGQCSVVFRQDGAILLTSGFPSGTVLATYTGAITAINTWFAFEIEVVINNTTGSISIRKNGNPANDFSLGSLNTRATTNNYANKIGVGEFGSTISTASVIDDFLWRSDASSVPWVGDVRCYTRMPAADVSTQWTRSSSSISYTPIASSSSAGFVTGTVRYTPFTPLISGSIGSVIANVTTTGTANTKCAIYTNNAGVPAVPIGTSTQISPSALGGLTYTFTTPVSVTAGTTYFMAVTGDANSGSVSVGNATSGLVRGGETYATFPVTNPAGVSVSNGVFLTIVFSPTAAINAQFVAEPQQDAAASYVLSSINGQADLYSIGSISNTPATIIGVTTRGYFQKSDAGTRNATVQLKSGANTVQGASTALNTTWGWIARNDLVDPATSAAWTATAVNNVNIGPVVTA